MLTSTFLAHGPGPLEILVLTGLTRTDTEYIQLQPSKLLCCVQPTGYKQVNIGLRPRPQTLIGGGETNYQVKPCQ